MKKKKTVKKTNRKKILAILIVILALCLFIPSLVSLLTGEKNIYKIDSRLKEIKKEKKNDKAGYETVAWLRVQGTNIDAPIIVYNNDEGTSAADYIDKEDYLWNENPNPKLFNKVSILGHNILNLSAKPEIGMEYFSRFDDLMSFIYTDFVKENKYVQYTIDGKDYMYKIFGVYFEEQFELDLYNETDYTKEQMKDFLKIVEKETLFDFDVEVNENDKFISLVTCTRMFGKDDSRDFVVVARQVREDESLINYDVEETNNYKDIKEMLKGDDSDEEV